MPKMFVVGDLNVDFFTYSSSQIKFGEEQNVNFSYSIGGNAANFATAAASLGLDVRLVSMIGDDFFTPFLKAELKRMKVKALLTKSDSMNGFSNIFVKHTGERGIFSNKGALLELDSRKVGKKILGKLSEGDVVYFGGFFHLPRMRKGFVNLLKAIKRKQAKVFFDTTFDEYGKWEVKSFLRLVDVFFVNEKELKKICKTRSEGKGAKKLFSLGAGKIVLKLGEKGAKYFSKNYELSVLAFPAKAINTTGAGDFFNAGYAYGFVNGFNEKACLLAANFVAGKKIEKPDYFLPTKKMLEAYLKKSDLINVEKVRDYKGLSKRACQRVVEQLNEKPDSVISIAAGKTPLGLYAELVNAYRRGLVCFSKATFVELDEYIGLSNGKDSFAHLLKTRFLDKVNFNKKNIFLFDALSENHSKQCRRIDSLVKKRGLDLVVLGIGKNAHIAFNEPNSTFSSSARAVRIHPKVLNLRGRRFMGKVPTRAFTLGMKTIASSKKIVLIANGRKKAGAIKKTVSSKPSPKVPASILQLHKNSVIIADRSAAKLL